MNKIKVSAEEVMRITEKNTTVDDIRHVRDIFIEIMRDPSDDIKAWATDGLATAMFMAGYVSGIRSERTKRSEKTDKIKPQEG